MNKILIRLLALSLSLAASGPMGLARGEVEEGAAVTGPDGAAASQPFGEQTRAWLELQRSGRAAGAAQPMSDPAAGRVYKRYLDSFSHPIPAFYERDQAAGGAAR